MVRHNSGNLFHLQAALYFSLQKHCRFQLISSASDQLEVVSSFECKIQVINQFLVYLLCIPSLHYSAEIGLHVPGSLKEQFWTRSGSLKAPGSLKVLGSLKVPYRPSKCWKIFPLRSGRFEEGGGGGVRVKKKRPLAALRVKGGNGRCPLARYMLNFRDAGIKKPKTPMHGYY